MRFFLPSFLGPRRVAAWLVAGLLFLPCVVESKTRPEKKKADNATEQPDPKGAQKPIPKAQPVSEATLPTAEKPFQKILDKAAEKPSEKIVEHSLADSPEYQAGLRALADGWSQVAAVKFERLLGDKSFNREDQALLTEHLVDALLRSKQAQKALIALTLFDVPEESFWEGQALLMLRSYHDAENTFKKYLGGKDLRHATLARLCLGKVILAQNRENTGRKELRQVAESTQGPLAEEAALWTSESELLVGREDAVLKRWDPGNDKIDPPEVAFVVASALMGRAEPGDLARAERLLRRLLDVNTSQRLHDVVAARFAECFELEGRHPTSAKFLRKDIDESTSCTCFDQLFAQLDRVKSEDDDTIEHYIKWMSMPSVPERRNYAMFYIAQWLIRGGHPELALGYLETLHAVAPENPRDSETMRLMMSIYGSLHADDRVLELAGDWRQRHGTGGKDVVDFLTAIIRFSRGEYADAMNLFERSAAAVDGVQRRRAYYNMGVAALMGGRLKNYGQAISALGPVSDEDAKAAKVQPDDASAGNLALEHALQLAAKHDAGAEQALQDFIKSHPDHARLAEAQIALAEFCLLDAPPRAKSAQAALDAAAVAIPQDDVGLRERLDYTRVWAAEAAEDLAKVASLGQDFATHWPSSPRADEMRMKAAQAYFRLGDFLRARTQFQELEEDHPESLYAETALYFAGKSAMSLISAKDLEEALNLFAKVVQRGGPLAMEARWQEVAIKRQQGNLPDAVGALDLMLASQPPPTGANLAALLLEKGELLVLQSRESPKSMEDAAEVFRSAATVPGIARQWRWRAQVLLAQTQQKLGKSNESLETSHDLIEDGIAAGSSAKALSPQELMWFYRAGFLAVDILESQKEWESAARLCERIAQTSGGRADEAKDRATRIREEHFLWDK